MSADSDCALRLMEVVVPCVRYRSTRFFYEHVLGLEPASEGRNHVFFACGGAQLALVNASGGDPMVKPSGHGIYLDLEARDLQSLKRRCQREGIQLLDERRDEHGRAITLRDPEGNLLNVFQAGTVGA
ncbi:MAG: VOC family protein [Myxococcota bacterium]|nr:VOC family protein [Myxococcota bacterium]